MKRSKPRLIIAPKCTAKSKRSGKRCTQYAIAGGTVCRFHGGSAPQVKRKAAERLENTAKRVLDEVMRVGYVDARAFFGADGKLLKFHLLDEDTARAVSSVTFDDFGHVKSFKLLDKNAALSNLMRHHGLFDKDKLALTDPDGKPLAVRVEFVDALPVTLPVAAIPAITARVKK